jgi:hypothetical protein
MSFWINRHRCRNCGSEINITGGMVKTTWMGPADEHVVCPNPSCHRVGFVNFEMIGPMDRDNPEHSGELIRNNHMDHT